MKTARWTYGSVVFLLLLAGVNVGMITWRWSEYVAWPNVVAGSGCVLMAGYVAWRDRR